MNWQGAPVAFSLTWVADGFDWSQIPARVLVCNWAMGMVHVHLVGGECMLFGVSNN